MIDKLPMSYDDLTDVWGSANNMDHDGISYKKPSRFFWVFPVIINLVSIGLGLISKNIIKNIVLNNTQKEIVELTTQYYTNICYAIIFLSTFLLTIFSFIFSYTKEKKSKKALIDYYNKKSENPKPKKQNIVTIKPVSSRNIPGFFLVLIALQIILLGFLLFRNDNIIESILSSKKDIELFNQSSYSEYTGSLFLDAQQTNDKNGYYYIDATNETYRIPTEIYSGDQLLQNTYTIRFLPNTNTIVELYDSDMVKHSGSDIFNHPGVDSSHWQYEDLLIKRNDDVYGYESLSDAGQKAFDLIYGEYFYTPSLKGKYTFNLPESINFDEYVKVLELYWTNNIYYDSNDYRYSTDSTSKNNISSFYITELENDESIEKYMQEVDRILSGVPYSYSDYDKILYIATYLVDNVEYYNGNASSSARDDNVGNQNSVSSENDKPYITGQGALFDGKANCFGYTKALDTMLRRHGFTTIPVFGDTPGQSHSWNMVKLDGEWYHIDTTWMDSADGIDYTYFLADDDQISHTHKPEKYAYCSTVDLPKSTDTKYNWFKLNDLYFETAEDALEFINSDDCPQDEKVQIRLKDSDEYNNLYELFKKGLGGRLDLHYTDKYYKTPTVMTFTKVN